MLKKKLVNKPQSQPQKVSSQTLVDPEEQDDMQEEDAKPKEKGKEKSGSLADAFNKVSLNAGATGITAGKYEAIVRQIVIQEPDPKGTSIRVNFELCDPEFTDKNQITTWFKVLDKDGATVDGGIKACKAMLAKLGYKIDEIDEDELKDCFSEISNENPGVLVKITYQEAKDGNTYQRVQVDSTCDNDVVASYRDNVAF